MRCAWEGSYGTLTTCTVQDHNHTRHSRRIERDTWHES